MQEIEGAGFVGEAAKGESGAVGGVMGIGIVLFDGRIEGGALDGPDAHEAPTGNRHGLDEGTLDFGLRIELAHERGEETVEDFESFVLKDDGLGQEAVARTIRGGFAFAFGSDGSAGFGAVALGGAGFGFGAHSGYRV